jgi:hypothetical protein
VVTFATILNVTGVLIQIVGAIIAMNGLIRTHDAYAERTVAAIARDKAERIRDQAAAVVRRLLHRRRTIAISGTANLSLGGSLRARAIVGWSPLDPKLKTRAAIDELDRRTRDLNVRIAGLDEKIADAGEKVASDLAAVRKAVEEGDERIAGLVRHAAIEGLAREAIGLFIVVMGGVLQAWGALIA